MYRDLLKTLAFGFVLASGSGQAQKVVKQVNFAQPTVGVAVNLFLNKIYVAAPTYGGATDFITVIDGQNDVVTANISVPRGAQLPVVDVVRDYVYVVGCDTYGPSFKCILTKIDGRTNKVVKSNVITTTEGDGIIGIAIDPIKNKLYLANGSNFRVDVVNRNTLHVLDSISTNGQEPFGISFNPLDHRLYVPYYTDQIQIFDTYQHNALVDTATFGTQVVATAVNPVTGNFYASDNVFGPSTEGAFDKDGNSLAAVPVNDTPYNLDIDLSNNRLFVLSTGIPALTEIDATTNTVISKNQNVDANYLAVNSLTHKVYVSGNSGITVLK